MIKKTLSFIFGILAFILLLSACSPKHITYFQDIESDTVIVAQKNKDIILTPGDIVYINIKSQNDDPDGLMKQFNTIDATSLSMQETTLQYLSHLIDNEGNISMPVLGKLNVGGKTKQQAIELITAKLGDYINEKVIVTLRILNYNITVLGEVTAPGTYTFSDEQATILNAISKAGDLTIYGKRENVKIIRKINGKDQAVASLNLLDLGSILNSSCYYLQRGDVVYIEPNGAKKRSALIDASTTFVLSTITSIGSMAALILSIINSLPNK
jgi:polysaccharide export outer membrane protein